jgi:hypothetical protein
MSVETQGKPLNQSNSAGPNTPSERFQGADPLNSLDALAQVLDAARKRAALIEQLKTCLVCGDTTEATRIARILCGLED